MMHLLVDEGDLYQYRADGERTRLGPAAPLGTVCRCGCAAGQLECQACKQSFCLNCWWKHRHAAEGRQS